MDYKMTRENLGLAKTARAGKWKEVREKIASKVEEIINAECVNGYRLAEMGFDFEYFTLRKTNSEKPLAGQIDMSFRRPWTEGQERRLELNVCAMGDFCGTDTIMVDYYATIGSLATKLVELTAKLNAVEGWGDFDEARKNLNEVENEIMRLDREEREREREARKAEIVAKLEIGKEIATGIIKNNLEYGYKVTGFRKVKIVRMTKKLMWFEGLYGQYRIDDVTKLLETGLKMRGWSFADEVKIEDFEK